MLDKERVQEKLKTILRERSLLTDFVDIPFEEFTNDENIHEYYGSLHHLQIALQAVLDVSQHITAQLILGQYKKNKEVFPLLAKKKIITKEISDKMEKAIGARNIFVHQYEDVDPKEIYNIIQNNLSDFDEFVSQIDQFLQNGETTKNSKI